ncbi:MAG: hypothetical protein LBC83_01325 [Oscillospiraceae bacterium]|jgi:hypothetical protein|nr:hypothetical protein [Oscillospiraceae bacterium]
MKKAGKRILAILLATLLLLGGMSVAAGAAQAAKPDRYLEAASGDTITVLQEPEEFPWYGLSGLELSVSGAGIETQTIQYDTLWEQAAGLGDIRWTIDIVSWDCTEAGTFAILSVLGMRNLEFVPVKTVDGVEYGYFEQERVFYATTALEEDDAYWQKPEDAPQLTLNIPATANFTTEEDAGEGLWFEFTAPEDGLYVFTSDGGRGNDGGLVDVDGNLLPMIDPVAELWLYYSDAEWGYEDFFPFVSDDDSAGDYNFAVHAILAEGETVYLRAALLSGTPGSYTVTVRRYEEISVKAKGKLAFHGIAPLSDMLPASFDMSTVAFIDSWFPVSVSPDWYGAEDYGVFGDYRGEGVITVYTTDYTYFELPVKVEYSAAQWAAVILLGGWAWMPGTYYGPFDFGREIAHLFEYGVGNALFDLLYHDWDFPYWMVSWLQNA